MENFSKPIKKIKIESNTKIDQKPLLKQPIYSKSVDKLTIETQNKVPPKPTAKPPQ
jgi:hypothetical protein